VGSVNSWLLLGEPLTLVDCGPHTDEAWAELRAGVEATGRRLEEVRQLVLTHPHPDHAGLSERVRRASGCAVYAHRADHRRLLDRPGAWQEIADFIVEVCRRAGAPEGHREAVAAGLEGFRSYAEPLSAVEALGDGEVLPAGGAAWLVLHTPGHARGALCLWEGRERVLASGDTLLAHISSNALLEPDPLGFRQRTLLLYRESLQRLAALRPRRVAPGHGDPVEEEVEGLIEGRLAFYERRAQRIKGLLAEGLRTPWDVAARLFPGVSPDSAFLAVSEVVGHLDLLAERGEIAFEGQEEGRGWEARLPGG
jgi:glyoxylase-like metal-dependent hydrolase (beta-lactamase superfamily II)